MAVLLPRGFRRHRFQRRQVKFRGRENGDQLLQIVGVEKDHKVHVVGQARFTVENGGHAAADHIADARAVQRTHKQQEQFRFGHG